MSTQNNRLWLGPLLLIFIIALIYIFSLLPSGAQHREDLELHNRVYANYDEFEFVAAAADDVETAAVAAVINQEEVSPCKNGGRYNETDKTCSCAALFKGDLCERPVCLNHGYYVAERGGCQCNRVFAGPHCERRCAGYVNRTTGECQCQRGYFGTFCNQPCFHGEVTNGHCDCFPGYVGVSCTHCDPSLAGVDCGDVAQSRRRGAVNSRLTLSGLSFCMITIGLLCVTARRRRTGLPSDDTWYRVFQPRASNRCRHDFICGGAWMPRDRALIVAAGRASITQHNTASQRNRTSSGSRSRSSRLATPPPSYTSVDNLNDELSPPTYEEATRTIQVDVEPTVSNEPTVVTLEEVSEDKDSLDQISIENEPAEPPRE